MKVLFELSHPKHYYQFRYLIEYLHSRKIQIFIFVREKDILRNLLVEEKQYVTSIVKYPKKPFIKLLYIPLIFLKYLGLTIKNKPDIIISKASPFAVLIKFFTGTRIVITPDSEVVRLTNSFVAPYSDVIITPRTFLIQYKKNQFKIDGFFEETYLSPKVFIPDQSKLFDIGVDPKSTFFVLRFVSWNASHDINHKGFTNPEKFELVEALKPFGKIFITAESMNFPLSLRKYLITIPPNLIHQLLYFSSLYVGDSQTMTTEAALLGTPAFRYNSFVGGNDMSNFKVLEDLEMAYSFSSFKELIKRIHSIIRKPDSKQNWQKKRESYFLSKADVNKQIIDILNF